MTSWAARPFLRLKEWLWRLLTSLWRLIQRVFAPHGNLLTHDLVAEVTVHVTADGLRKTLVSKMDSQAAAHQAVQGLVLGGIEVGQQHGVSVNWAAMNSLAPYQGQTECMVCHQPINPTEPAVWVMKPHRLGHLRCAVKVEDVQ